jgi:hypothetical protein
MSKSIKEISQIASKWWADKIINTKFDNGDNSENGGFAMMLAKLNTKDISIESKEKFAKELDEVIEEKINHNIENGYESDIILDVDYGPCKTLADIAEKLQISNANFPWKTTMWISKNRISVKYGYSTGIECLYANKEYWRKSIESSKDAISRYKSGEYLSWIEDISEREKRAKECIAEYEKNILSYEKNLEDAEE